MKIYALFSYEWTEDKPITINDNEETVYETAINESFKNPDLHFRLETWENGKMIGGWRFFNKGEEITDWIRNAIGITKKKGK